MYTTGRVRGRVRGRVHGPFTAVYTAVYTRIRVHRRHKAVYATYTRPCTRPVHSRIHGPCTRPVHGSVNVRVHGPCTQPRTRPRTRPVVYMAGRLTGLCTRSQTARYCRVLPVTTVYTARSQRIHGSVYGRVRRPLHGRPTRAYVYTAVKRPCMRHVHVLVHGQYTVVYMAGRSTRPCTRAETARYGRGPCIRP